MRPLRYSINVTLDGCCDHRAMTADEDLHRRAVENLANADALLFGRVTYEMMEAGWRPVAQTGVRPEWMPELGLIDEYEFVVQPRLAGHGPTLFAGLSKYVDLKLVSRLELGSGAVALRYEPIRNQPQGTDRR
jgi:dihydrofolate reductase